MGGISVICGQYFRGAAARVLCWPAPLLEGSHRPRQMWPHHPGRPRQGAVVTGWKAEDGEVVAKGSGPSSNQLVSHWHMRCHPSPHPKPAMITGVGDGPNFLEISMTK